MVSAETAASGSGEYSLAEASVVPLLPACNAEFAVSWQGKLMGLVSFGKLFSVGSASRTILPPMPGGECAPKLLPRALKKRTVILEASNPAFICSPGAWEAGPLSALALTSNAH